MAGNLLRRAGLGLGVVGLLASTVTFTSAGVAAACVPVEDAHADHASARTTGRGHGPDHGKVSARTVRQINEQVARYQRGSASASATALPSTVMIDVHVTNVWGRHIGERDLGLPPIRNAINVLNTHYAGRDEAGSLPTRFRFRLASYRLVKYDPWYHAEPMSNVDQTFQRRHHRGNAGDLNLYLREPRAGSDVLLGYARFPWQIANAPKLDGVTVHPETLPGRKLQGYNQGDTVTHEVGHWLGLWHVFEGGCLDRDGVPDTTPQLPMFQGCRAEVDCLLAGANQPDNYMQYTQDYCMRTFTPGQVARMDYFADRFRF